MDLQNDIIISFYLESARHDAILGSRGRCTVMDYIMRCQEKTDAVIKGPGFVYARPLTGKTTLAKLQPTLVDDTDNMKTEQQMIALSRQHIVFTNRPDLPNIKHFLFPGDLWIIRNIGSPSDSDYNSKIQRATLANCWYTGIDAVRRALSKLNRVCIYYLNLDTSTEWNDGIVLKNVVLLYADVIKRLDGFHYIWIHLNDIDTLDSSVTLENTEQFLEEAVTIGSIDNVNSLKGEKCNVYNRVSRY